MASLAPRFSGLDRGDRVLIVSGSYRRDYSYQENIWAERLVRRGCAVRVLTAGPRTRDAEQVDGYTVAWLRCRGLASRQLYFENSVAAAALDYDPKLILWFGPPQGFGASLATMPAVAGIPTVAFMGQNRRMHAFDWTEPGLSLRQRAHALAYRWVRGPAVAAACRHAHLVVANTVETPGIIRLYLRPEERVSLRDKIYPSPLGFDPDTFGFDPDRRTVARRNFGFDADDVVAILSSRFSPEKYSTIRFVVEGLCRALDENPRLKALVVGLGDDPLSAELRRMRDARPEPGRMVLAPFAKRQALSDAFHAADIAIFARPSISAQEALGAGVYCVFSDDGSLDWLLDAPDDGALFATGDPVALVDALAAGAAREAATSDRAGDRRARAERAGRLDYDHVIDGILGQLRDRLTDSRPP